MSSPREFGPRAAAAGHHLEAPADSPAPARGDGERVLQIGRVLIENALVHTPAGTTVRVSTELDGGRALLVVANDGPAIPAEARERIFERFYRLDGGRASGSGLGLAIARELAEVMGGRIEVDSEGDWTLFRLVLSADVPEREHDHVFHVIGVTWAVDVRVVTFVALIFHVRGVDRDSALFFFGRVIDRIVSAILGHALFSEHDCDSGGECRFAMVHVTDRADVHVRLVAFECFFSHVDLSI